MFLSFPNSSPLLTYTATIVSDSYIPDNQGGQESFALARSIEEKYAIITSQISQKRLKINQYEPINNKYSSDKVTFYNFVDFISQIQKETPTPKTTYGEPSSSTTNCNSISQNTNQKIPSYATRIKDEDDILISNDNSNELLHVQPKV
ncbi:hypothetical protein F8M41_012804 [Gigaspora margarita]|uniref:Uncharacterized protein n=1 Tax=Gigaspora margarita TaxID=4874 RepID=A0A8H4B3Z3_GIGMA|nr:hypothetical protein F8M41_012804 [Gigaspora margarita]